MKVLPQLAAFVANGQAAQDAVNKVIVENTAKLKVPALTRFSVVITPHESTRTTADDICPVEEVRAYIRALVKSNTGGPVPDVKVERVK